MRAGGYGGGFGRALPRPPPARTRLTGIGEEEGGTNVNDPAVPASLVVHAEFVRRLARHLVGTDVDADDVAQETFVRALARPPRDPDRPRPWLAGVVRNVVRRFRRDAARRDRRERAGARAEAVLGPDEIAARAEVVHAVAEAVRELEEPYRAVILLRHYDDLPPRQIAARLAIPVETVHTRLRRAHERLRRRLDGEAGEIGRSWRATMLAFVLADASRHAVPAAGAGAAAPLVAGAALGKGFAAAAVVVVLGAVVAFLPRREAVPPADDPGASAASLAATASEGSSNPPALAAAPPRASRDPRVLGGVNEDSIRPEGLSGVCVDEQGQPLSRATVYVVPKGTPGADELRFPHGVSDESGRFDISKAAARGAWVCAVKDGFLPASLDGDTLGDGSALRLVLPAGREVVVTVSSSGPKGLPADVWAAPVAQQGAVKFPAPGTPWKTEARGVVPESQATLRIGTRDSVQVTASPNHTWWLSEPDKVVLAPPEREAKFRLLPSGILKIRVLHEDGSPFDAPFQAVRLPAEGEKVLNGMGTTNPDRTGAFDDGYGIRPGTYRLRVFADGYAVWTSGLVTFANPGDAVEVRAPLVPDPTRRPGTLVLSIPVAEAVGTSWYREPTAPGKGEPGALVRTAGGNWFSPGGDGWGLRDGELHSLQSTWSDSARELRIRVPAGVYDVLVWDRSSWTCGFAGGMPLTADGIATAKVKLVVGVRVHIADLVAKGDSAKDLRIRANGVDDLPAAEDLSAGRGETYRGTYGAPFEAVLKPLPFDTLHVSWRDAAGEHEKDVKAESKPQEDATGPSGAGPR